MNTNIQISRMEKGIIHKDLPFEIMEAVFEVHNGLGPGYSEGRGMNPLKFVIFVHWCNSCYRVYFYKQR